MMKREEMAQQAKELGPWFYPFDFGDGVKAESYTPQEVAGIFETRREMAERAVRQHFGARLPEISCLDIGCHEGFYTLAMARLGVGRVAGLDVREENLRRARFAAAAMGCPQIRFLQGNCEQLPSAATGQHELTLFLGVLYHLENPMLALRNVAAVTKELCVIETQVIDEVTGQTEWGAQAWTHPYQGALAVIDETVEHSAEVRETGATPLALCPSPRALETMLRHAGFRKIERVAPAPGAYEQLARGKRVVYAAYK
ncbi:MAG: methyltransferase domain-containing protein [Acidobacteria bacterium]|nr:methyltransferase domain-containing protein [Acidobacteriota bacterium]